MVAMHVHCQLHYFLVQGSDDTHQCLMTQRAILRPLHLIFPHDTPRKFVNERLHSPGAMYIERNIDDLRYNAVHDLLECLRVRHLNDLLTQVIAKLVAHDIG